MYVLTHVCIALYGLHVLVSADGFVDASLRGKPKKTCLKFLLSPLDEHASASWLARHQLCDMENVK